MRSLGELARVDIRSGAEMRTTDADAEADPVGGGFEAFLKEVEAATRKSEVVDPLLRRPVRVSSHRG